MDIHFPLALLAQGETLEERGFAIFAYACDSRGRAKLEEDGFGEDKLETVTEPETWAQIPKDVVKRRKGLRWAASKIGGSAFVSLSHHIRWLDNANAFLSDYTSKSGSPSQSPFVRVHGLFMREGCGLWNHYGMTYREFAVLCAVLSVIGDKGFSQVTREQIRIRCLGAWNEATNRYLSQRMPTDVRSVPAPGLGPGPLPRKLADFEPVLTENKIRATLQGLQKRGLLFCVCPDGRNAYYSRTMQPKELMENVRVIKGNGGWLEERRRVERAARNGLKGGT